MATATETPAHDAGGCSAVRPWLQRKLDLKGFFTALNDDFGGKFVAMLFSAYFGVKGAGYSLVTNGQLPYYRDYMGVGAVQLQRLRTFALTPWALKSIIGALSDTFPICGYHKIPYMYFVTTMGFLSIMLLGFADLGDAGYKARQGNETSEDGNGTLTAPSVTSQPVLAAVLFFFVMLQLATVDLLTEGQYASKMVQSPKTGPSLVSWVWASYFLGSLFVSSFIGPVADNYDVRTLFIIGAPLLVQFAIPLLLGWFGEMKRPDAGCCARDTQKIKAAPRFFVVAVVMAICAIVLNVSSLFIENAVVNFVHAAVWGTVMCGVGYWALPRTLAHANVYMFLAQVLYFRIDGVLDMWFGADERCIPGGPHFDQTYYVTVSGVIGSVASLAGVSIFQVFFKDKTFRYAFWMTTVLKVVASVFDIIMVTRAHRPAISDKVMYLFGDRIIGDVVMQLDFMPSVVLVSKVCPPGYEAVVYALLAGFQNFGSQVASYGGLVLIDVWGIEINPPVCTADGLWSLIVVTHMVLPLITVPLTFWMLPDSKLSEDILAQYTDGAVEHLEPDWLNNGADGGDSNRLDASLLPAGTPAEGTPWAAEKDSPCGNPVEDASPSPDGPPSPSKTDDETASPSFEAAGNASPYSPPSGLDAPEPESPLNPLAKVAV
eukprot:TRINITY_DN7939_c0_g2_i1.p1 TRINITY_DN7939_c0_g2~~TRINITY_DN7939_c0_g2_i1.p1  ORF type:complete len:676 (+),score=202.55 TRINITY_DN7939_c0_g2_i1:55-2028(+)